MEKISKIQQNKHKNILDWNNFCSSAALSNVHLLSEETSNESSVSHHLHVSSSETDLNPVIRRISNSPFLSSRLNRLLNSRLPARFERCLGSLRNFECNYLYEF
jgi:hypothetical protein